MDNEFYDEFSREQLIEHIRNVESDCRVEIENRMNQINELDQLRAQLAAEIERREKAEVELGLAVKYRTRWNRLCCQYEGKMESLEQALQKSEAEKVELATLVMDGQTFIADFLEPDEIPISDKLYNQIEFDDIYNATLAKAKAIIERGK